MINLPWGMTAEQWKAIQDKLLLKWTWNGDGDGDNCSWKTSQAAHGFVKAFSLNHTENYLGFLSIIQEN